MIKDVRRYDYGELGTAELTPQGFLKVPGFATRTGVFTYLSADGSVRRELRHPDDVFAPESLVTLKYAPVTIEHPPEMITPENVVMYSKGHTTERVEVNRDLVETDFIVEDQSAIDAIQKNGIRETSSGYVADIDEEEGEFNGAPYNFRQKNIRYNHVALVKRGRAGPEVRLRMDSADAIMKADEQFSEPKRSEYGVETSVNDDEQAGELKGVFISGKEIMLPPGEAAIIQDMLDRFDELRARTMQMEEAMKAGRTDKLDVDVSKPTPSPQVKVEQMMPDGRSSAGKVGAGDKSGAMKAKGLDEEEKPEAAKKDEDLEKDDADLEMKKEEGKKDYQAPGSEEAMAPVDLLKSELEEVENAMKALGEKKMDLEKKMDMHANPGLAQGEKMDSADVKAKIRARVKLERSAEKLVSPEIAKRFDSWSDAQIMAAVVKAKAPRADLEGKSFVYLQTRFDSIVEAEADMSEFTRKEVGRAMLGGFERKDSFESADPAQARLKMISETRELWKSPLKASK